MGNLHLQKNTIFLLYQLRKSNFFSSNIKYPSRHNRETYGQNIYKIEMLITINKTNHYQYFQPCTNMERFELFGKIVFLWIHYHYV